MFANCKVHSIVYYQHRKGEYVLPHDHQFYEFIFYINGAGQSYIGTEKITFKPNTAVIVRPKERHDEISDTESKTYIISFSPKEPLNNMRVCLNKNSAEFVLNLLKQIQKEFNEEKQDYDAVMSLLMARILIELQRSMQKQKEKGQRYRLVKNAKRFMKENYSHDIDFKQIANSCCYSYDRFRHIFLSEVGKTMNQYLLDIRFSKAKELLENTEKTVKEVGFSCGFNATSHFVNSFTAKMGISPNKYRKIFKLENDLRVTVFDERPYIILDTDLGGDCDDAGALALLNVLKNNNEAEILGITHNTSLRYGAACIDVINRYYGNELEIGQYGGEHFLDSVEFNKYAEYVARKFGSKYLSVHPENAVTYLRRALAGSLKKVRLVVIGQLNNCNALLTSPADDISPFTGRELIQKKVEEVVIMGGVFGDEPIEFCGQQYDVEYNIRADIPSARNFIDNCPVNITFADFKIGYKVKTLGFLTEDEDNPVGCCYKRFCNGNRESWDLIAVLYAVRGEGDVFDKSPWGRVTVSEDGKTKFFEDKNGTMRYLTNKIGDVALSDYIDNIIKEYNNEKTV